MNFRSFSKYQKLLSLSEDMRSIKMRNELKLMRVKYILLKFLCVRCKLSKQYNEKEKQQYYRSFH